MRSTNIFHRGRFARPRRYPLLPQRLSPGITAAKSARSKARFSAKNVLPDDAMRRVRGGPLGESMSRQGGAGRKGMSWALLAGYASRRWAWEQCWAYAALCQVGRNRGGGASARNAKSARTGVTCPEQRSVQSFHYTIGPRKWWRGGAGVAGGDQRLRGRVWHKGHFCVPRRAQGGLPTPWACDRPPPPKERVEPSAGRYRGRGMKQPSAARPCKQARRHAATWSARPRWRSQSMAPAAAVPGPATGR